MTPSPDALSSTTTRSTTRISIFKSAPLLLLPPAWQGEPGFFPFSCFPRAPEPCDDDSEGPRQVHPVTLRDRSFVAATVVLGALLASPLRLSAQVSLVSQIQQIPGAPLDPEVGDVAYDSRHDMYL